MRKTTSKSSQRNRVTALIVVDQQPLRDEYVRELKSLQKDYLKLRGEIERHESVVRPLYRNWYFELFGKRISLVEKLRAEYDEKMALFRRMRDLYTWRGYTRQKAFSQASDEIEAIKQQELFEDEEPEDIDEPQEEINDETQYEASYDFANEAAIFEFEISRTREVDKGLKYYYRKLAQALHPDRVGELTPALRELWIETQKAYQDEDVDRLKVLWTECMLGLDPSSNEIRFAEISAAIKKLRKQIREAMVVKKDLAKSDPSWRFDRKSKDLLSKEINNELFEAEMELKNSIGTLDREIRAFSGERRRPSRPSRDNEASY